MIPVPVGRALCWQCRELFEVDAAAPPGPPMCQSCRADEPAHDRLRPAFGDPCGPWIKTFAWRPRWTADAGWVWFRRVWKRHVFKHQWLDGGSDFWWQWRRFAPDV